MTQTHMAREIAEIPDAAQRFLDASLPALQKAGASLRQVDPYVITTVARGSSDHAATYLKYTYEMLAGVPIASVGPSVASIYKRPLRLTGAAALGISQSGRSPDIVEMMRSSAEHGALTIAITNHADSPMATAATHCLALQAGEELSVAATKTFVNSAVAGLALLAEWRQDRALQNALAALPDTFAKAKALDWSPLTDRLTRSQHAFVLGRGPGVAIAHEAALKMKETSGIHAEAYSAAEVLHGPAAIVQAGFPVLSLGVNDAALPQMIATAQRLVAQGADVLITGADVDGALHLPSAPDLHPLLDPLVLIVSYYTCVEALSRQRGFDPDTPPHLRKVTETH